VFDRRGASLSLEMKASRPRSLQPGQFLVPAGHEQLMAAATLVTWIAIPIAFALVSPSAFGTGGATADYAASVGWSATTIGTMVPAHLALAAGLVLFSVRTFGHFEGTSEPPPAKIEDDAVLQEIIDQVEGRRPTSRQRAR
jgi:hypothetical protein